MRPHERWIWTELIGFDSDRPDQGVAQYLDATGFVPDAICLLITSPDFALSHQDWPGEVDLPPDFCSRDGHEHNPQRSRQVWTNRQLRSLIDGLHERGVEVYLTMFTRFYGNRYHHEWISDHREVCKVFRDVGWSASINALSRLADGRYFEDIWVAKLCEVLDYYGFDGWHGADGFGPLNGPIYRVCVSDDMVAQFADSAAIDLADEVTRTCGHDTDKLEVRAAWLWRHAREAWIAFYVERWAGFWHKVMGALHAAGKQAVINSAWGRAPFESLYRYGVDYRRIAETGVDGIVVETVAAGLCMDPRPSTADPNRHHDFLAMLMLIKACVPDTRLIFLHNVHDTVEEWDAIHHKPTVLEREIYSLSNVFRTLPDGRLAPCADGFLACLGDGISAGEWAWLRDRWELAFSDMPRRALGATLVWSDAAMDAQQSDFITGRSWTVHRLLFHLMSHGAPIQTTANVHNLDAVQGAILVLNPHLLPPSELESVLAYEGGPIVLVGPDGCRVHGGAQFADDLDAPIPEDVMGIVEPYGYWDHMEFRPLSDGFLRACADTIVRAAGAFTVTDEADSVCLMVTETSAGALRIAIKNKTPFYARPTVELSRPIDSVTVLTPFPSVVVTPEGDHFAVRVPPDGITVVEVRLLA